MGRYPKTYSQLPAKWFWFLSVLCRYSFPQNKDSTFWLFWQILIHLDQELKRKDWQKELLYYVNLIREAETEFLNPFWYSFVIIPWLHLALSYVYLFFKFSSQTWTRPYFQENIDNPVAKEVFISGSFNSWQPIPMNLSGGLWSLLFVGIELATF